LMEYAREISVFKFSVSLIACARLGARQIRQQL
jgi:hypothetical protein